MKKIEFSQSEISQIRREIQFAKISIVTSTYNNDPSSAKWKEDLLNFFKALPGELNLNRKFSQKIQKFMRDNGCSIYLNNQINFDQSLDKLSKKLKQLDSPHLAAKINSQIMTILGRLTLQDFSLKLSNELKFDLRYTSLKEDKIILDLINKFQKMYLPEQSSPPKGSPAKKPEEQKKKVDNHHLKNYIEAVAQRENSDNYIKEMFEKLDKESQTFFKPLHDYIVDQKQWEENLQTMMNTNVKGNKFGKTKNMSNIQESLRDVIDKYFVLQDQHSVILDKIQQLSYHLKNGYNLNREHFLSGIEKLEQDQQIELKTIERYLSQSLEERNVQIKPETSKYRSDPLNVNKRQSQPQECSKEILKIAELQQIRAKLIKEIELLVHQKNQKDKQISFYAEELARFQTTQTKVHTPSSTHKSSNNSPRKLQQQLNQEKQAYRRLKEEKERLSSQIENVNGQRMREKAQFEEEIKKLKKQVSQRQSLPANQYQTKVNQSPNIALKQQNQRLLNELSILSSENQKLKRLQAKNMTQHSSISGRGLNQESVIHSMTQNERKLQSSIKMLSEKIKSLQKQVTELNAENSKLKQENQEHYDMSTQLHEQKERVVRLTKTLEECKSYTAIIDQIRRQQSLGKDKKNFDFSPSLQKEKNYQQDIENLEKEMTKKDQDLVTFEKKIGELERQLKIYNCQATKRTLEELKQKERQRSKEVMDLKILLEKKEQEILKAKNQIL